MTKPSSSEALESNLWWCCLYPAPHFYPGRGVQEAKLQFWWLWVAKRTPKAGVLLITLYIIAGLRFSPDNVAEKPPQNPVPFNSIFLVLSSTGGWGVSVSGWGHWVCPLGMGQFELLLKCLPSFSQLPPRALFSPGERQHMKLRCWHPAICSGKSTSLASPGDHSPQAQAERGLRLFWTTPPSPKIQMQRT